MWIQFDHVSGSAKIDTTSFYDLTLAINKHENVNCYNLEDPVFNYFESEAFSGNLSKGGSVNCEKISLYAHASGTHTECALHVTKVDFDMRSVQIPLLMMCNLVTVLPEKINEDHVINLNSSDLLKQNSEMAEAIIVRTKPNPESKRSKRYSGCNPPFFDPNLMLILKEVGYKHLLTDLPSIDKESDEGLLQAHKNWFISDGVAKRDRTITELIFIPDNIPDGYYALSIQSAAIETDAVPSRILIFPCK